MGSPNPEQNKTPLTRGNQSSDEVGRLLAEWREQAEAARNSTVRKKTADSEEATQTTAPAPEPEPKPTRAGSAWWRYPLAILAFVTIVFLGAMLFGLAFHFVNYLSPRAFQNSEAWMYFASDVLSAGLASYALGEIANNNHKFCYIVLLIAFVYFLFVSIWNYLTGTSLLYQAVSTGACGIVCLVMAVQHIRKEVTDRNDGWA